MGIDFADDQAKDAWRSALQGDVREVLNATFCVLSAGRQWKGLPKDFPPKSTVHFYFMLWNWGERLNAPTSRIIWRRASKLVARPTQWPQSSTVRVTKPRSKGILLDPQGFAAAKRVRTRGHFSHNEAAEKLLFLVLRNAAAWKGAPKESMGGKAQLVILFEDRFFKNTEWSHTGSEVPSIPGVEVDVAAKGDPDRSSAPCIPPSPAQANAERMVISPVPPPVFQRPANALPNLRRAGIWTNEKLPTAPVPVAPVDRGG